MSGIAPKQNAFKFKIAPHKQKSIVKYVLGRKIHPPPPLANGDLNLSTPKHIGKSGTAYHNDSPLRSYQPFLFISLNGTEEETFRFSV
jgi:hypothetical protein